MASLKESTAKFEELKVNLASNVEHLGQQLQQCNLDLSEGVDPLAQLETMKIIAVDVEKLDSKMTELKSLGENLLTTLEALDCRETPKGREIQMAMANIPARFNNLRETVSLKLQKLDDVTFTALLEWVEKKRESFAGHKLVSLDRDTLNQHIQSHRELTSEIDNYRGQMMSLVSRCENMPLYAERATDLVKQFKQLKEYSCQRESTLENVVKKLEVFNLAVYQLESWHAYADHSVKQESVDLGFLFTKIKNLYNQKQEKSDYMESVNKIGQELLNDEKCGDKNRLEELVKELRAKWTETHNKLVELTVTAAQHQIDEYAKHLEKVTKEKIKSEVVNSDPEKVTKQHADHQSTHAGILSRHKKEAAIIEEYKMIYKSLTKNDATDIHSLWVAVQKQHILIIKQSESRMAELREAMPAQLSTDIEMEGLQDWIEVDTVGGKKERELRKNSFSKSQQRSSRSTSKGHSSKSPSHCKQSSSDKSSDEKSGSTKKDPPEKDSRRRSHSEASSRKDVVKAEPSIFDCDVSMVKKSTDSSYVPKPSGETSKKSGNVQDSSNKKEAKSDVKKNEGKSSHKQATSCKKETPKSKNEPMGPADIVLGQGNNRRRTRFFRHAVVLLNFKESVRMPEIRRFFNPVAKAGFIEYFREHDKVKKIGVFMNSDKDVTKCVEKLNKKLLCGVKVTVMKAKIHDSDSRSSPHSDKPKDKTGMNNLSLYSSNNTEPNNGSLSGKKPVKKNVIPFDEIKKGKGAEIAAKMMEHRTRRSKDITPVGRSSRTLNSSGRRPKLILTMNELRSRSNEPVFGERRRSKIRMAEEERRRIQGLHGVLPVSGALHDLRDIHGPPDLRTMHGPPNLRNIRGPPDLRNMRGPLILRDIHGQGDLRAIHGPPDSRPFSEDYELELERRRVMLEKQFLEQERLQAERERVALERERQMRQLGEVYAGDQRRGHKRDSGMCRDDGSYWSQPKRPLLDQDTERNIPHSRRHTDKIELGRSSGNQFNDRRRSFDDLRHTERNGSRADDFRRPSDNFHNKCPAQPKLDAKIPYTADNKSWVLPLKEDIRRPYSPAVRASDIRRSSDRRLSPPRQFRSDRSVDRIELNRHTVEAPRADIHTNYALSLRKSNQNGPWK